MAANGVFCLEGDWDTDLRIRDSVEPGLLWLERLRVIKYIHRDVGTKEELSYYLNEWRLRRYAEYPVLYLGFHGSADGRIWMGRDKDGVAIDKLLEPLTGRCEGRTIYFASCLVLGIDDAELKRLVKKTKAKAIIGYEKEIDWLHSAAFDLLLLTRLLDGGRTGSSYKGMQRDYGKFAHDLGLVAATANTVYRAQEPEE